MSDDQRSNIAVESAGAHAPSPGWKRVLNGPVLTLAAISFVSSLGIAVMLPLIPLFAVSLGASPLQLGLLTSAFALANSASQLGAGLVLDRYGALGFIRGGIATYAGANFLIAAASSAAGLIAYRTLAGLGGGVNIIATRLYVSQVAVPQHLALVNGVLSAAFSAGQVAGPALGGIVAAFSNLRTPFLLVGVTSALAFVGSLLLPRPKAVASTFVQAGAGDRTPLLGRPVLTLLAAQFFVLASYGGFITTYAPYVTQVLGWSTLEVGIVFSFFGAGSIALGPWLSHVADRRGRRVVGAMACLPVALVGVLLAAAASRPIIYAVMMLAGGGITTFTAAWFALLTEVSPEARRGRIFGLVSAGSNLGTVAGAMVASGIWQRASLGGAVLSASGAVILGGLALLALPRERRETSHRL